MGDGYGNLLPFAFCTLMPACLLIRYQTFTLLREKISQRNREEIERAATMESLHALKGKSTNLDTLFVRFKLGNQRLRSLPAPKSCCLLGRLVIPCWHWDLSSDAGLSNVCT